MAAILVLQNNETAAMLVYQTNPVGVQLFCYVNTFFCYNKFAWLLDTSVNTAYKTCSYRAFFYITETIKRVFFKIVEVTAT